MAGPASHPVLLFPTALHIKRVNRIEGSISDGCIDVTVCIFDIPVKYPTRVFTTHADMEAEGNKNLRLLRWAISGSALVIH